MQISELEVTYIVVIMCLPLSPDCLPTGCCSYSGNAARNTRSASAENSPCHRNANRKPGRHSSYSALLPPRTATERAVAAMAVGSGERREFRSPGFWSGLEVRTLACRCVPWAGSEAGWEAGSHRGAEETAAPWESKQGAAVEYPAD